MTRTALNRKSSPHVPRGGSLMGFTLIELLATVTILAILIVLIFPAVSKVVAKGKSAKCLGNVRSAGIAYRFYVADQGGRLPSINEVPLAGIDYYNALIPAYLPAELRCPNADGKDLGRERGFRYGWNDTVRCYFPSFMGFSVADSKIVLVSEMYLTIAWWSATHLNSTMEGSGDDPENRLFRKPQSHFGGLNLGFLDGHAEWIKPADITWRNPPTYGMGHGTEGYYYNLGQISKMR